MRVVKSHSIFLHIASYSCYEIGENDIEDKWSKQKKKKLSSNTFTVGDLMMSRVFRSRVEPIYTLYIVTKYNIIIICI